MLEDAEPRSVEAGRPQAAVSTTDQKKCKRRSLEK